jgi:hypothetical protein
MDCKTWPDVPESWYELPHTASCQYMWLCLREKDPNNNLNHHLGTISHYTMFLGRNNNPGSNSKLVWSEARSAGSGGSVMDQASSPTSTNDWSQRTDRRRASTLGEGNGNLAGNEKYEKSLEMMVRLEPMVKKHLNKVRFNALGDLVGARL